MRLAMRSAVGRGTWSRVGTGALVGAVAMFLARDLDLPTLVSYARDRTLKSGCLARASNLR